MLSNFRQNLYLGMSIAFSHGTANALIFGMALIQSKGLSGFILWAIPNSLCMALFGYIYHKKWLREEALDNKLIKILMIVFQAMMLLFQMKLLQTYFEPLLGNKVGSFVLASLIAGTFVIWMYRHGLVTSVLTDNWQGYITLGSIALAVGYCFITNCPTNVIPVSDSPDWLWGIWTTAVYTGAIICDLQHWRRADIDDNKHAFYYATGVFAILMILIGMLGCYNIPIEVRLFLCIPVLGLATSTIDSIAVALHECVNKKVGTAFALGICCLWWVFLNKSAVFVWNMNGTMRILIASLIIIFSAYWYYKNKHSK